MAYGPLRKRTDSYDWPDKQVIREGVTATPYWPLLELGPWRVLSLDTAVPGAVGGQLAAEELEFLAAQLAREPEAPTLIFMHRRPKAGKASRGIAWPLQYPIHA